MVPSALYFFDGRCTSGCYHRSTTADSACSHGVQHLQVWPGALQGPGRGMCSSHSVSAGGLEWPQQSEEIHPRVCRQEGLLSTRRGEEGQEEAWLITANPGWTGWSVEGRVPAAALCPIDVLAGILGLSLVKSSFSPCSTHTRFHRPHSIYSL